MDILTIENLSHSFSGIQAISECNLTVCSNQIMGIIGPNGAGKTTLFNILCGIYPAQKGNITLNQQRLNGLLPEQITKAGVARTFQNIRLFKHLSVLENVKTALNTHYSLFEALLHRPTFYQQESKITEEAYQLLQYLSLSKYINNLAGDLPYGLQRRLEIVRALALQPKVLLLDEPACGMNRQETQQLIGLIQQLCEERNLAILLIDHQMRFVMSLCENIMVLNFGKTIAKGDAETIKNHPAVIQSYLGTLC